MHRALSVLVIPLLLVVPSLSLGEQPAAAPPTAAQIEQLQNQLNAMQKEMHAMQEQLKQGNNIPDAQRQAMQQHMGQLQRYWQGMHSQCCMWNPTTGCPHMGASAPPQQ